ncbi:MAG: CAP domain-containing protein [Streptomyces sp.]|uniref:CAP domain-containing protein n=1 Tax=Streptomyces sp. TaxID=1931 RepID=UPI003D6B5A14
MGRHRRVPQAPEPVIDDAGLDAGHRLRGSHRKRRGVPVRTGVLGASAAMAMGAVAVASGLVPGPGGLSGGGHYSDRVEAGGPTDLESQGAPSSLAPSRSDSAGPSDRRSDGSGSPSASPSTDRADRSSSPGSSRPSASTRADGAGEKKSASPSRPGNGAGTGSGSPDDGATASASTESAAEAAVLKLVNNERAQAGCRPVTNDAQLADLAGDFSQDMAERGFFSHTSPDGESPWDRARQAGVDNMGGENIARGQADAEAVMDSWMNSPGHKANILNCEYRTLGVGAHFAAGGPWWTQNFGF